MHTTSTSRTTIQLTGILMNVSTTVISPIIHRWKSKLKSLKKSSTIQLLTTLQTHTKRNHVKIQNATAIRTISSTTINPHAQGEKRLMRVRIISPMTICLSKPMTQMNAKTLNIFQIPTITMRTPLLIRLKVFQPLTGIQFISQTSSR